MRVAESIEINRAIEEVWDFVADPSHDPVWCPKVKSVDRQNADRWLVRHKPVPLRPSLVLTVERVAADRPQRLVLRQEDETSIFDVEYRLEPTFSGTRFSQISDFKWKRLPTPIQRLLASGVRSDVRRQLRELKHALETPERTRSQR